MSGLILQAGSDSITGTKDPRLGITALRVKCWAPDLSTAIFGVCPEVGLSLVENQPRTFTRKVAGENAGYDVLVTLEGATSEPTTEGEKWTIEGTTSEDAIEAHPDYAQLLEIYGGTEDPSTSRAKWPKTLDSKDSSQPARRNPMHGAESYLVPGLVLTREYTAQTIPSDLTRGLGTIDDPPPGKNGRIVHLSGARNWLKVRARATWRGNVWVIEESWLLSGPYGFVWEVYRYPRLV